MAATMPLPSATSVAAMLSITWLIPRVLLIKFSFFLINSAQPPAIDQAAIHFRAACCGSRRAAVTTYDGPYPGVAVGCDRKADAAAANQQALLRVAILGLGCQLPAMSG